MWRFLFEIFFPFLSFFFELQGLKLDVPRVTLASLFPLFLDVFCSFHYVLTQEGLF